MSQSHDRHVPVFVHVEEGAALPAYATGEAAGADVRAYIKEEKIIPPGQSALIPTGLFFAIPEGYEIQVRPRSGLALKHQVTVLNTPGTIDSDYRGELCVILINHGTADFVVTPGMRIAQLVIAPSWQAQWTLVDDPALLSTTARGQGGFGHTGFH